MKFSQLEAAALRRQRVLDYLRDHPGSKMDTIGATLFSQGDTRSPFNTIKTMVDWGEIRYEGTARTRRYWALTTLTRSAEESRRIRLHNAETANVRRHTEKTAREVRSRYSGQVHTSGATTPGGRPIPNQGGQGAVRARVHVSYNGSY